jgi:hypothetical protein
MQCYIGGVRFVRKRPDACSGINTPLVTRVVTICSSGGFGAEFEYRRVKLEKRISKNIVDPETSVDLAWRILKKLYGCYGNIVEFVKIKALQQ